MLTLFITCGLLVESSVALEKTMYAAVIEMNVLYMSVRSFWSILLFKPHVSIMIYLILLPIIDCRILKFSITVILFFSPSIVSTFSFLYLGALIWVTYIFIVVITWWWIYPFTNILWPLCPLWQYLPIICFVWYNKTVFWLPFFMEYPFLFLQLHPICPQI